MISVKIQLIAKGLQQKHIAKKAGVHKSYISNILAGRDKPSKIIIEAFKSFGIDIEG